MEIKDEMDEEMNTLDGYLDQFGLNMEFFARTLKESFDNLTPGKTENRLHLDMLAKLRGIYKQNEKSEEQVTYAWGEDKAGGKKCQ